MCRATSEYDPHYVEVRHETRRRTMLAAKIQGTEVRAEAPAPLTSNVVDLMAALRKSLGEAPKAVTTDATTAPKVASKRAQKAVEEQRKQPGLKLPIEGGKKSGKSVAAPAAQEVEPVSKSRHRA